VQSEFSVREEEDLSGRLKAKEFAYRSTHLIIGLKPGWLEAPNYSGLGNLVAEVQIRTMPMHAWAEIEHKLNYKTSIGLPEEAQRKLFRISALFEIADEELDSIRKASVENQNRLEASASKELLDLKMAKLDIDFLAVVMNSTYPDRPKSENYSPGLLKEILDAYLTTEDVINAVLVQQPLIEQIKKHLGESESTWTQTAALANALEIYSWTFYRKREKLLSGFSTWRNLVDFSRQLKINSDLSKNRTLP
jgi:putative GTP pyrophosphokinase